MHFLDSFDSFRLDTVGLLAILGEGSVVANYQASTLSKFILLPRLMPAPQAFLLPSRPHRLNSIPGTVVGSRSGNVRHVVNRLPHILLDGEESLKPTSDFSVRHIHVEPARRTKRYLIRSRSWGLLSGLSMVGCGMSIALLVLSVVFDDGWALLATLLLSFLSTVGGWASLCSLRLAERLAVRDVPISDVVIVYPNASFLVIECEEELARALFFGPERCHYIIPERCQRSLALFGTMMLMFGVICLTNAGHRMQIAFGASYIILNAAYWFVATLPERIHWDFSTLRLQENDLYRGKSFTEALWRAIRLTKTVHWVEIGRIAPKTDAWDEWLQRAEAAANGVDPGHWDFDGNLSECISRQLFGSASPNAGVSDKSGAVQHQINGESSGSHDVGRSSDQHLT